jgi:hypothetical protein
VCVAEGAAVSVGELVGAKAARVSVRIVMVFSAPWEVEADIAAELVSVVGTGAITIELFSPSPATWPWVAVQILLSA